SLSGMQVKISANASGRSDTRGAEGERPARGLPTEWVGSNVHGFDAGLAPQGVPMTARITLTAENGPLAGKEYAFTERRTCLVGRGDDCDLRLPNGPGFADVSRHH